MMLSISSWVWLALGFTSPGARWLFAAGFIPMQIIAVLLAVLSLKVWPGIVALFFAVITALILGVFA